MFNDIYEEFEVGGVDKFSDIIMVWVVRGELSGSA